MRLGCANWNTVPCGRGAMAFRERRKEMGMLHSDVGDLLSFLGIEDKKEEKTATPYQCMRCKPNTRASCKEEWCAYHDNYKNNKTGK